MYRSQLSAADEQIRKAHAAFAERDRLVGLRQAIASELDGAEAEVTKLAEVMSGEQRDVRRYEGGVWAFLYDLFADRQARLSKEQREAAEAQLRLEEATALRDRLRTEAASIDQRLSALGGAESDLAAARAGKQAMLIAGGDPNARELEEIARQLGLLDAEGRSLDEALAAGARTHTAMGRLVEVLGSARNWGTADILTDSLFTSWIKREKLDDARNLAAAAQAELTAFRQELGDIGIQIHAEVAVLADHHRFLDTWFDNIFSDLSVQSRIKQAQESTDTVFAEIGRNLEGLRARRTDLLRRSEELSTQRVRLIEAS